MSLKRNVVANFAGSIWSTVINIAFVPIYLKLMGPEAYGLVGIFTSLQVVLSILDLGLSQTISREMARLGGETAHSQVRADTARTCEIIYWGVAGLIMLFTALISPLIAYYWLNPVEFTAVELRNTIFIMAFTLGLRWPTAIYMGGLLGMQRHVLINSIGASVGLVQGLGALGILYFIKPSVNLFFVWQAIIAVVQVFLLRSVMWRSLPRLSAPTFSKHILSQIWRFAIGMSGIAALSIVLTQLDKIVLSKLLPLTDFGYYTMASTVAMALYKLISPIFTAYYPRLTELVAKNQTAELTRVYHQGCQLIAVMVLPAALILAFFAKEIIYLWTGSIDTTQQVYIIASILVVGNALNGLMNMPYALQLAYGWTSLAFYTNLVGVLLLAPALYFAAIRWGAIGTSGIWVLLNLAYVLVSIHLMHRRLIPQEKWRWYLYDVFRPLAVVAAVIYFGRLIAPAGMDRFYIAAYVSLVFLCAFVASIANSKILRRYVWSYLTTRLRN